MAVTIIGSDPAQIEYRLGQSHACVGAATDADDIPLDLRESPLIWVGEALADLGITAGTELTQNKFGQARAIMHGRHPGTGERLIEHKLGVVREAKVPIAELVRQIEGIAREADVPVAEVLLVRSGPHAGKQAKTMLSTFERAQRAIARDGELAVLRADHAGAMADAADLDIEAIWDPAQYAAAVSKLTKTITEVNSDGTLTEKLVPNREIVGNFGYDAVLDLGGDLSGLPAIASAADSTAMYAIFHEETMNVLRWLENATAYGMRGHHGDGATADITKGNGFAGWAMVHRSARPVGGAEIGDPHWHVHFTLANMTMGQDGTWSTIAAGGRDLIRHLPVANKMLRAQVRRRLTTEHGVVFQRNERTGQWQIAGFPDALNQLQSKRTQAIDAELRKKGYTDTENAPAKVKQLAKATTREAKTTAGASPDESLRRYWRRDAIKAGLDPDSITSAILGSAGRARSGGYAMQSGPSVDDLVLAMQDVDNGLTARRRRFSRLDAIGAVAEAVPGATEDEITTLANTALEHAGFVKLIREPDSDGVTNGPRRQLAEPHMSNAELYTTRDIVAAERVVVRAANASHVNQTDVRISPDAADMAASTVEKVNGFALSGEQWRELIRITTSGRQLDALIGGPGAGKTTLMAAVRTAFEAAGFVVGGAATQGAAAQTLQAEAGIDSRTVAQWLWQVDNGPGLRGIDVLILDEAGMTNDRDRARLYLAAEQSGTSLVETGDPKQLRGVGCGSMFSTVHRLVGGGELVENRRQTDADERAAIAAWRRGDYTEALTSWAERDRLIVTETGQEAISALLATWVDQRLGAPDLLTELRGLLIVAATNEQVTRLNNGAQAIRAANGELGPARTYTLRGGEILRLHTGDVVLVRINERRRGEPAALNGYRGIVSEIHANGSVDVQWERDTRDGRVTEGKTLSPDYIAKGGIGLGYAITIHKSQGLTVGADGAHWTGPDSEQRGGAVLFSATGADNPGDYVAASRHKNTLFWFLGRKDVENHQDEHLLGIPKTIFERTRRVITKIIDRAKATATNANDRPALVDLGLLKDPEYERAQAERAAQREARRASQEQRAQRAADNAGRRVAATDLLADIWGGHDAVDKITDGVAFDTVARRIHELAEAGGDPRALLSRISLTNLTSSRVHDSSRVMVSLLNNAIKRQNQDNEHPPQSRQTADIVDAGTTDSTAPIDHSAEAEDENAEQIQREQVADLLDEAWNDSAAVDMIVNGSAFGALAQNLANAADYGHDPLDILTAINPAEAAGKDNPSAWVAWKIRAEIEDDRHQTTASVPSGAPPGDDTLLPADEDHLVRLDLLIPVYERAVERLPRDDEPTPDTTESADLRITSNSGETVSFAEYVQRGPAQPASDDQTREDTAIAAITAVWTHDADWIVASQPHSVERLGHRLDQVRQAGYDPTKFMVQALRVSDAERITQSNATTVKAPDTGPNRAVTTYGPGIPHPNELGTDPAGFAASQISTQLASLTARVPTDSAASGSIADSERSGLTSAAPPRRSRQPDSMWPSWLPPAPAPETLSGRDKAVATAAAADARRIRDRVVELGRSAAQERPDWVQRLGPAPTGAAAHSRYVSALTTLAAYREQHKISGSDPLGPPPPDGTERTAFDVARSARDDITTSMSQRTRTTNASDPARAKTHPTDRRHNGKIRHDGDEARQRAQRILDQQRRDQQNKKAQRNPTRPGPTQGPRPGV